MMLCWTWLDERLERLIAFSATDAGRLLLDGQVQSILYWADGLTTLVSTVGVVHVRASDYFALVALTSALEGGTASWACTPSA